MGGVEEELTGERNRARLAVVAPLPSDARLQLTLAAINTLFRLLHTTQDNAKTVWEFGGREFVVRIITLASRLKELSLIHI